MDSILGAIYRVNQLACNNCSNGLLYFLEIGFARLEI